MIKKILLVLALLVAGILVYAAFRPDIMRVTRSATLAAPPAEVFAVVNDYRRWNEWSPWAGLDPAMVTTLEGPPTGVGAIYKWSGNSQVGEGRITIVESIPQERIAMKLSFIRPFPGDSDVQFTFAPEDGGTEVTWAMQAPQSYLGKLMGVFINCEKMCGDGFLEGLAKLESVVAKPAPAGT